jgi:hypothetical protein
VRAFLLGIAFPLRIVEILPGEVPQFRLSALGRHLLLGGPEPPAPAAFQQTLFVQPNAEILAYRQGLTPTLVGELSRFATWKQLGPACTLELTADDTYRGLESGLTLAAIKQTLDRHTARPVPNAVMDLLKRWADKRERIMVFPSATLVEFSTPAELEAAMTRGIVSVQLTDRIGLTADGRDPEFQHLRLIGNRDYDGKPVQCVSVAADGITLTVDAAQSDLLLEAEITRLAEPVLGGNGVRQYRLTPESLIRATKQGATLDSLDKWFGTRTGEPLSAAGRLLAVGRNMPGLSGQNLLVMRTATVELADGLAQWPPTAEFLWERLGPTAFVISRESLASLQAVLATIGQSLETMD